MKKLLLIPALLFCFCINVFGQQPKQASVDTIYIYEKVIVYDTLRVYDTIRITKTLEQQLQTKNSQPVIFLSSPAATLSKNGIILHENSNNLNSENMKMKKVSYLSAMLMLLQGMVGVSAQEQNPNPEKTFPAQMSFVYPISTMGKNSVDYRYYFSLNMLSGKTGAISGMEFGGLFNRTMADMSGFQAAGLGNKTGNVTGLQFGGLGNISANVTGMQTGGLGNISGNVTGLQFAGLANVAESVHGVQVAGLANIVDSVSGLQFAGLANITDNSRGIQVAGLANISDEVSGLRIAGLYNQTKTLRGFQISLVSVADSIESGASLALVNIVKKGAYHEWWASCSDYVNVELGYKLGIQRFYTIYSVGFNFVEDQLWVSGIGFGNRTRISSSFAFQPELIYYVYYPKDFKDIQLTSAGHLKLGLVYNVSPSIGISLAPSVYVRNSDKTNNSDYYKVSPISSFYTHGFSNNSKLEVGLGLSLGVTFR